MSKLTRSIIIMTLASLLTACTYALNSCPVTEPEWLLAPDDPAVNNPPAHGYYFVNEDQSIWASAGWTDSEYSKFSEMEDGVKVGWFRPEGAELTVTGQRLDEEASSLEADLPCCYPTRFQASGLYFPTEGCWEVTARAEDASLTFVVWIEP
jgi:hypothetical protein